MRARRYMMVALVSAVLVTSLSATTGAAGAASSPSPSPGRRSVVDDSGLPHTPSARGAQIRVAPAAAAPACIGDGRSGKRVQLTYVRTADQPSLLDEVRPQMQDWAREIDRMFLIGAQETGGFRRVRWVTDASCVPTVVEHVAPVGTPGFTEMLVDLSTAGLRPANRKLLVAANFGGYCGFGELETDDSPGPSNRNNTQTNGLGMVGAVGHQCWSAPVAAHELGHTLGAVQPSAPNATPGGHCLDEYDLMCYFDGSTDEPIREVCPVSHDQLPDCNQDDYFNANPAAGSYLATHWNTANSSFLDRAAWSLPPDRPEHPISVVATASATVSWETPLFDGGSPINGYVVTAHPSGRTVTVGAEARSVKITGLADGEVVWFTVQSTSAAGTSAESIETEHLTPTPPIYGRSGFVGEDPWGLAADAAGNVYVGTKDGLIKLPAGGGRNRVATGTTRIRPVGVAIHPTTGEVYIADQLTNRVRRISAGKVITVAGGATPIVPSQLAFDAGANLYITEPSKNRVWKRTPAGALTIFAGSASGAAGYSGDGGPATAALLRDPSGVAVSPAGTVYIADRGNHRVRRVDPSGTISHFIGNGANIVIPELVFDGTDGIFLLLPRPRGIAWGNGRLFVQSGNRVVAVTPDGLQVTYVGAPGEPGNSGDGGPARNARIGDDVHLATSGGRLLVLDLDADRLRQVKEPAPASP